MHKGGGTCRGAFYNTIAVHQLNFAISVIKQAEVNRKHARPLGGGGAIIISTATVLVRFGYVQHVDIGMYISLMVIGLVTAVGYEDTAAATASASASAHRGRGGGERRRAVLVP